MSEKLIQEILLKMNYDPSMTLKENQNLIEQSMGGPMMPQDQGESFTEPVKYLWKNWDHETAGYAELALVIGGILVAIVPGGQVLGGAMVAAGTGIGVTDAFKYYDEDDWFTGTLFLALNLIPGDELIDILRKVPGFDKVITKYGNKITPEFLKKIAKNPNDFGKMGREVYDALIESFQKKSPIIVKRVALATIKAFKAKLLGMSLEKTLWILMKLLRWTSVTTLKILGTVITVDQLWTLLATPDSWRQKMRDKSSFAKYIDMIYEGTLDDLVVDALWALWQKLWNKDGSENIKGREEVLKDLVNQSDFKDVAVESKYAKDVIFKADSSWKSHMEKVKQKNLSKLKSDKLKSKDATFKDVLENKFEFKFGDMGQGVKQIQGMLKKLGYDLGTSGVNKDGVDGNYGINTLVSVIEFQKEYNLSERDGIVGDKTLKKLIELTK